MKYIENSKEITGYRVKVMERSPFEVKGYTIVSPPGKPDEAQIPRFWDTLIADGRLAKLIRDSSVPICVLGVGSGENTAMEFWITVIKA